MKNKIQIKQDAIELIGILLKEITKENDSHKLKISSLEKENEELLSKNNSLEKTNDEMLNSKSWKLTKPLRAFINLFR